MTGEVSERLKELALESGCRFVAYRGFESLPLRQDLTYRLLTELPSHANQVKLRRSFHREQLLVASSLQSSSTRRRLACSRLIGAYPPSAVEHVQEDTPKTGSLLELERRGCSQYSFQYA